SGRFVNRPNYQDRYWKDSYFHSIEKIKQVCAEHDINIVEASYRWLAFHSMLNMKRGDGIIVGASNLKHLQQNMAAMAAGPLPEAVVSAFEQAWTECRSDAPEYFRFYTPKQ
ncbi:MAG: aldo/keto reductase, partial [Clostridiaceae bacterium]|nr:aldo/keto reductase [Clostridiaceae bacterium]